MRNGLDQATLAELFHWSEADFNERMAGSAIYRVGYERWLRNLAVGLGNAQASASVLGALASRREDRSGWCATTWLGAVRAHGAMMTSGSCRWWTQLLSISVIEYIDRNLSIVEYPGSASENWVSFLSPLEKRTARQPYRLPSQRYIGLAAGPGGGYRHGEPSPAGDVHRTRRDRRHPGLCGAQGQIPDQAAIGQPAGKNARPACSSRSVMPGVATTALPVSTSSPIA